MHLNLPNSIRLYFVAIFIFGFQLEVAEGALPEYIKGTETLSGKSFSAASLPSTKKGTVLVFISAKCPCSQSHTSELKSLANDFPEFNFLGIHANQDESLEVAKQRFSQDAFAFPVIEDQGAQIADKLKAFKTPHAFLLDNNGQILYQGGITNSADGNHADDKPLRNALQDVQASKTVKVPESRTLGCVISRKTKNVW